MIYFDSETCGFTGPMVLLQYAIDDGPIILHEIFNTPVKDTLATIKMISESPVVGFNLVFDWFHLTKIYNILDKVKDKTKPPFVLEVMEIERTNPSEWCLYPPAAFDIMLYCRRGPYQATMARKPILIKKVPKVLANKLRVELNKRITLDPIYFSKKAKDWKLVELEKNDPGYADFINLQLDFSGSSSLRAISHHALGEEKGDFPPVIPPTELPYWPYGQHGARPWGSVIHRHIATWQVNSNAKHSARYYATQDVHLTRALYLHFKKLDPSIKPGDDDSMLACALGATRWKGFEIEQPRIDRLLQRYRRRYSLAPRSPKAAKHFIKQRIPDEYKPILRNTSKPVLESILRIPTLSRRDKVPIFAVMAARQAEKRINILSKLKDVGRFHPDFKIIGTRSNRMAGGSENTKTESLNPQGIPSAKTIRRVFTLHGHDEYCYGGDAKSYEVTIMAAEFKDPRLDAELKSGKKFHGLLGSKLLKMDYNELIHSEIKYKKVKNTIFGVFYGAQAPKVSEALDINLEDAELGLAMMVNDYAGIKTFREKIFDQFCSMRQPNGIGTRVYWHDPADYCETMLGFKRYFTLENAVCRALFDLSNKLPPELKDDTRVTRRDRVQTATGAIQSALYASSFAIQASNLRQAGNHKIQSVGGQITKSLQRNLCDLQPYGINKWVIRTMNVHDEVLVVTTLEFERTKEVLDITLNKYRKFVPLLDWDWRKLHDWSGTK